MRRPSIWNMLPPREPDVKSKKSMERYDTAKTNWTFYAVNILILMHLPDLVVYLGAIQAVAFVSIGLLCSVLLGVYLNTRG